MGAIGRQLLSAGFKSVAYDFQKFYTSAFHFEKSSNMTKNWQTITKGFSSTTCPKNHFSKADNQKRNQDLGILPRSQITGFQFFFQHRL